MNYRDYFRSPQPLQKAVRPGWRVQLQARAAYRNMPPIPLKPHQVPEKGVHRAVSTGSIRSGSGWRSEAGTSWMGRHARSAYFYQKRDKYRGQKEMGQAKQEARQNLDALRSMKAPVLKNDSVDTADLYDLVNLKLEAHIS